MSRLEARFNEQMSSRADQDSRITTRLDDLQAQVIELQKVTSPTGSPSGGQTFHAVPPTSPTSRNFSPTFQMVVGGWREGERKDYIESELTRLWAAAGVADSVREIQTFGKRPRCAKVTLLLPEGELASKRAFLLETIKKVKEQNWVPRDCSKPAWVLEDRPPAARSVNKAVAIMGNFIEKILAYTQESLEVDSWPAARAYLGDRRISGASPGVSPSQPPRKDDYIVWPVTDPNSQVSVWLDLKAVAACVGMDVSEVHRRWTLQAQG